jgi:hypothetical protein
MLGFLGAPSTPLLRDGEDGVELAEKSPSRQRDVGPGGNTIVTVQGANGSVFANLPPCDLVSFLAIVQSLKVPIFEFEPDTSNSIHMGSRTHVVHLTGRKGIVFKSEPDMKETLANKVLVSEILVLRHPILSQHPNIHRLLGVALQPKFHETKFLRVLPHLVFEKSDYGSLWEFMIGNPKRSRALSFLDRLRLCKDIGDGIVAMHSFSKLLTYFPNLCRCLADSASLHRYRTHRHQTSQCPPLQRGERTHSQGQRLRLHLLWSEGK